MLDRVCSPCRLVPAPILSGSGLALVVPPFVSSAVHIAAAHTVDIVALEYLHCLDNQVVPVYRVHAVELNPW